MLVCKESARVRLRSSRTTLRRQAWLSPCDRLEDDSACPVDLAKRPHRDHVRSPKPGSGGCLETRATIQKRRLDSDYQRRKSRACWTNTGEYWKMPPWLASGKMLSCALGRRRASSNEFIVGAITSLSPFAMRTG